MPSSTRLWVLLVSALHGAVLAQNGAPQSGLISVSLGPALTVSYVPVNPGQTSINLTFAYNSLSGWFGFGLRNNSDAPVHLNGTVGGMVGTDLWVVSWRPELGAATVLDCFGLKNYRPTLDYSSVDVSPVVVSSWQDVSAGMTYVTVSRVLGGVDGVEDQSFNVSGPSAIAFSWGSGVSAGNFSIASPVYHGKSNRSVALLDVYNRSAMDAAAAAAAAGSRWSPPAGWSVASLGPVLSVSWLPALPGQRSLNLTFMYASLSGWFGFGLRNNSDAPVHLNGTVGGMVGTDLWVVSWRPELGAATVLDCFGLKNYRPTVDYSSVDVSPVVVSSWQDVSAGMTYVTVSRVLGGVDGVEDQSFNVSGPSAIAFSWGSGVSAGNFSIASPVYHGKSNRSVALLDVYNRSAMDAASAAAAAGSRWSPPAGWSVASLGPVLSVSWLPALPGQRSLNLTFMYASLSGWFGFGLRNNSDAPVHLNGTVGGMVGTDLWVVSWRPELGAATVLDCFGLKNYRPTVDYSSVDVSPVVVSSWQDVSAGMTYVTVSRVLGGVDGVEDQSFNVSGPSAIAFSWGSGVSAGNFSIASPVYHGKSNRSVALLDVYNRSAMDAAAAAAAAGSRWSPPAGWSVASLGPVLSVSWLPALPGQRSLNLTFMYASLSGWFGFGLRNNSDAPVHLNGTVGGMVGTDLWVVSWRPELGAATVLDCFGLKNYRPTLDHSSVDVSPVVVSSWQDVSAGMTYVTVSRVLGGVDGVEDQSFNVSGPSAIAFSWGSGVSAGNFSIASPVYHGKSNRSVALLDVYNRSAMDAAAAAAAAGSRWSPPARWSVASLGPVLSVSWLPALPGQRSLNLTFMYASLSGWFGFGLRNNSDAPVHLNGTVGGMVGTDLWVVSWRPELGAATVLDCFGLKNYRPTLDYSSVDVSPVVVSSWQDVSAGMTYVTVSRVLGGVDGVEDQSFNVSGPSAIAFSWGSGVSAGNFSIASPVYHGKSNRSVALLDVYNRSAMDAAAAAAAAGSRWSPPAGWSVASLGPVLSVSWLPALPGQRSLNLTFMFMYASLSGWFGFGLRNNSDAPVHLNGTVGGMVGTDLWVVSWRPELGAATVLDCFGLKNYRPTVDHSSVDVSPVVVSSWQDVSAGMTYVTVSRVLGGVDGVEDQSFNVSGPSAIAFSWGSGVSAGNFSIASPVYHGKSNRSVALLDVYNRSAMDAAAAAAAAGSRWSPPAGWSVASLGPVLSVSWLPALPGQRSLNLTFMYASLSGWFGFGLRNNSDAPVHLNGTVGGMVGTDLWVVSWRPELGAATVLDCFGLKNYRPTLDHSSVDVSPVVVSSWQDVSAGMTYVTVSRVLGGVDGVEDQSFNVSGPSAIAFSWGSGVSAGNFSIASPVYHGKSNRSVALLDVYNRSAMDAAAAAAAAGSRWSPPAGWSVASLGPVLSVSWLPALPGQRSLNLTFMYASLSGWFGFGLRNNSDAPVHLNGTVGGMVGTDLWVVSWRPELGAATVLDCFGLKNYRPTLDYSSVDVSPVVVSSWQDVSAGMTYVTVSRVLGGVDGVEDQSFNVSGPSAIAFSWGSGVSAGNFSIASPVYHGKSNRSVALLDVYNRSAMDAAAAAAAAGSRWSPPAGWSVASLGPVLSVSWLPALPGQRSLNLTFMYASLSGWFGFGLRNNSDAPVHLNGTVGGMVGTDLWVVSWRPELGAATVLDCFGLKNYRPTLDHSSVDVSPVVVSSWQDVSAGMTYVTVSRVLGGVDGVEDQSFNVSGPSAIAFSWGSGVSAGAYSIASPVYHGKSNRSVALLDVYNRAAFTAPVAVQASLVFPGLSLSLARSAGSTFTAALQTGLASLLQVQTWQVTIRNVSEVSEGSGGGSRRLGAEEGHEGSKPTRDLLSEPWSGTASLTSLHSTEPGKDRSTTALAAEAAPLARRLVGAGNATALSVDFTVTSTAADADRVTNTLTVAFNSSASGSNSSSTVINGTTVPSGLSGSLAQSLVSFTQVVARSLNVSASSVSSSVVGVTVAAASASPSPSPAPVPTSSATSSASSSARPTTSAAAPTASATHSAVATSSATGTATSSATSTGTASASPVSSAPTWHSVTVNPAVTVAWLHSPWGAPVQNITFKLTLASTNGWLGFGFRTGNGMVGSDVWILRMGGANAGSVTDAWTSDYVFPDTDGQQDVRLISVATVGSSTTWTVCRAVTSSDNSGQDVNIHLDGPQPVLMAWSLTDTNVDYHDVNRQTSELDFRVGLPSAPGASATPSSSTASVGNTTVNATAGASVAASVGASASPSAVVIGPPSASPSPLSATAWRNASINDHITVSWQPPAAGESTITMRFELKSATGWLGFCIRSGPGMAGCDIWFMRFNHQTGQGEVIDMKTTSYSPPTPDASQDVALVSAALTPGRRLEAGDGAANGRQLQSSGGSMVFTVRRALQSSDPNDSPINVASGSSQAMAFAWSTVGDGSLVYHATNKMTTSLDLSPTGTGGAAVSTVDVAAIMLARAEEYSFHALIMAAVWCVLVPVAVLGMHFFPHSPAAIGFHRWSASIAVSLTLPAAGQAMFASGTTPLDRTDDAGLSVGLHRAVGITVTILMMFQALMGAAVNWWLRRAGSPPKHWHKFRWAHRWGGRAQVIMAIINCYFGVGLMLNNAYRLAALAYLALLLGIVIFLAWFDVQAKTDSTLASLQAQIEQVRLRVGRSQQSITLSGLRTALQAGRKWVLWRGLVVDVAPLMERHPGGAYLLESCLGTDITPYFTGSESPEGYDKPHAHSNVAREQLLKMVVGALRAGDAGMDPVAGHTHVHGGQARGAKGGLEDKLGRWPGSPIPGIPGAAEALGATGSTLSRMAGAMTDGRRASDPSSLGFPMSLISRTLVNPRANLPVYRLVFQRADGSTGKNPPPVRSWMINSFGRHVVVRVPEDEAMEYCHSVEVSRLDRLIGWLGLASKPQGPQRHGKASPRGKGGRSLSAKPSARKLTADNKSGKSPRVPLASNSGATLPLAVSSVSTSTSEQSAFEASRPAAMTDNPHVGSARLGAPTASPGTGTGEGQGQGRSRVPSPVVSTSHEVRRLTPPKPETYPPVATGGAVQVSAVHDHGKPSTTEGTARGYSQADDDSAAGMESARTGGEGETARAARTAADRTSTAATADENDGDEHSGTGDDDLDSVDADAALHTYESDHPGTDKGSEAGSDGGADDKSEAGSDHESDKASHQGDAATDNDAGTDAGSDADDAVASKPADGANTDGEEADEDEAPIAVSRKSGSKAKPNPVALPPVPVGQHKHQSTAHASAGADAGPPAGADSVARSRPSSFNSSAPSFRRHLTDPSQYETQDSEGHANSPSNDGCAGETTAMVPGPISAGPPTVPLIPTLRIEQESPLANTASPLAVIDARAVPKPVVQPVSSVLPVPSTATATAAAGSGNGNGYGNDDGDEVLASGETAKKRVAVPRMPSRMAGTAGSSAHLKPAASGNAIEGLTVPPSGLPPLSSPALASPSSLAPGSPNSLTSPISPSASVADSTAGSPGGTKPKLSRMRRSSLDMIHASVRNLVTGAPPPQTIEWNDAMRTPEGTLERPYSATRSEVDAGVVLYVKRYPTGPVSSYLANIAIGQAVHMSGLRGLGLHLDDDEEGGTILAVTQGTGIAPLFDLLQSIVYSCNARAVAAAAQHREALLMMAVANQPAPELVSPAAVLVRQVSGESVMDRWDEGGRHTSRNSRGHVDRFSEPPQAAGRPPVARHASGGAAAYAQGSVSVRAGAVPAPTPLGVPGRRKSTDFMAPLGGPNRTPRRASIGGGVGGMVGRTPYGSSLAAKVGFPVSPLSAAVGLATGSPLSLVSPMARSIGYGGPDPTSPMPPARIMPRYRVIVLACFDREADIIERAWLDELNAYCEDVEIHYNVSKAGGPVIGNTGYGYGPTEGQCYGTSAAAQSVDSPAAGTSPTSQGSASGGPTSAGSSGNLALRAYNSLKSMANVLAGKDNGAGAGGAAGAAAAGAGGTGHDAGTRGGRGPSSRGFGGVAYGRSESDGAEEEGHGLEQMVEIPEWAPSNRYTATGLLRPHEGLPLLRQANAMTVGRLNMARLVGVLPDEDLSSILCCGKPAFVKDVRGAYVTLGLPKSLFSVVS